MNDKQRVKLKTMTYLILLQSLILITSAFIFPKVESRIIIFGFSYVNIIIIAISFFIVALTLFLAFFFHINQTKCIHLYRRIKKRSETGKGSYLILGSMAISYLLLVGCVYSLVFNVIGPEQHSVVYLTIVEWLPLIILWSALNIEIFLIIILVLKWHLSLPDLAIIISERLQTKSFFLLWVVSILITSILHWLMLISDWPIHDYLPEWYWLTTEKATLRLWLIIPLSLLFFFGYWLLTKKNMSERTKTLIVILIGYILMIGFSAVEGSPYQVLSDKRYISGHRNYIAITARDEIGNEYLYNYESALGHDRFFATKPPGVFLVYRGILRMSSWIFPTQTYEEKYHAINHTVMIVFPMIALSTTIGVEKITKQLTSISPPQLPGYLMLIFPNFLLMLLTIDQAIIPLLFSVGLLLGITAFNRRSWSLSFLLGIFIYLSLYLSFSLLPMVMIIGLWVLLEIFQTWHSSKITSYLKMALGFSLGFFLVFLIFRLVFGYSPLVRYQNAINVHEAQRILPTGVLEYFEVYLLNNVEFATWVGFPVAVTMVFMSIVSIICFLWGKSKPIDTLFIAFLGTYIYTNHFSNTISEVGRLWLFFIPIMSIFTITFVGEKMMRSRYILFLMVLQLITAFQIVQHIQITWE